LIPDEKRRVGRVSFIRALARTSSSGLGALNSMGMWLGSKGVNGMDKPVIDHPGDPDMVDARILHVHRFHSSPYFSD
jgi:hypothetical protein